MTVTPKLSTFSEHTPGVIRSLVVLLCAATVVAAVDLTHKALEISAHGGAVLAHERSTLYAVGVAMVCVAWAAAVAWLRAPAIGFAAGLLVGGAVGNVLSLALWPSLAGVPNPIVSRGVAFNLADVSAGLGLVLLVPTVLVFALRNRGRLFEPV
jgi:lipoprotein signal peptidase